jgi:hypothetical protein
VLLATGHFAVRQDKALLAPGHEGVLGNSGTSPQIPIREQGADEWSVAYFTPLPESGCSGEKDGIEPRALSLGSPQKACAVRHARQHSDNNITCSTSSITGMTSHRLDLSDPSPSSPTDGTYEHGNASEPLAAERHR